MERPDQAGMRSMRTVLGGHHLGAPGTPESLTSGLRELRAADVVQTASKISVHLERLSSPDLDSSQADLVRATFSEPTATRLLAMLERGGGQDGFDTLFFPGQLMTLARLALAYAQPGPPTSFDDGKKLGSFVTLAAQINDVREGYISPSGRGDAYDLALYGLRAGAFNQNRYPPYLGGRSYRMWLASSLRWPSDLEQPEEFCERTLRMTLPRFVAIAAGPAIARLDMAMENLGDVPLDPAEYFEQSRVTTDEVERVFRLLTHSGSEVDVGAEETYWSLVSLAQRPYLPCGTSLLAPASVRFAVERATTGIFWMMHTAHEGRVGPYTQHFGRMFEDYCLQAALGMQSRSRSVCGEISYGSSSSRKLSSDVLVTEISPTSATRFFVECRAGRPTTRVLGLGDHDDFDRYVNDVVGKLKQMNRCIRDHMSNQFAIPDDLAGPNDTYFPVLVLDEPFLWTIATRIVIDEQVAKHRLFAHPQVARPVIIDVNTFDSLVSAVEAGHALAPLLLSYISEGDRLDPLDHTLYAAVGPLRPSAYCMSGWDIYTDTVKGELF